MLGRVGATYLGPFERRLIPSIEGFVSERVSLPLPRIRDVPRGDPWFSHEPSPQKAYRCSFQGSASLW